MIRRAIITISSWSRSLLVAMELNDNDQLESGTALADSAETKCFFLKPVTFAKGGKALRHVQKGRERIVAC